MDSELNLPLSLTYKWWTVSEPLVHLHGRFLNAKPFSSVSWIPVATWIQRRHDEWTAPISNSALKESDGPSYFHLKWERPNAHSWDETSEIDLKSPTSQDGFNFTSENCWMPQDLLQGIS